MSASSPTPPLPPIRRAVSRALLGLFIAVHADLALTDPAGPLPVLALPALAAAVGAAALVVLVPDRLWRPWVGGSAGAASVAAVLLVLPDVPSGTWPGYSAWPVGAATLVAIGLALRGRLSTAWILMLVVSGICIGWSIHGADDPVAGATLVVRQIGILAIGSIFAVGARRSVRTVERLRRLQQRSAIAAARTDQEREARRDAVRPVLARARPLLTRLSQAGPLGEGDRTAALVLEGALRDRISLAPLMQDDLQRALDAGRARGVDVVVLTDAGVAGLPESLRVRAASWIADQASLVERGTFVARAVVRGGRMRLTASTSQGVTVAEITVPLPQDEGPAT